MIFTEDIFSAYLIRRPLGNMPKIFDAHFYRQKQKYFRISVHIVLRSSERY